jgi:hypothetical protein
LTHVNNQIILIPSPKISKKNKSQADLGQKDPSMAYLTTAENLNFKKLTWILYYGLFQTCPCLKYVDRFLGLQKQKIVIWQQLNHLQN